MKLLRSRILLVASAAFLFAGCDITGLNDDLTGFYDYAGTVYNQPGSSVNGQMDIRQYYRSDADAEIEWFFYEGSRRVVAIESVRSVPVYVESNGRFRFDVEGQLEVGSGQYRDFRLTHEGYRNGRSLRGTWRLVTDFSEDAGTFTARR